MERLELSPGSFFSYRSRELINAAPYFNDRLTTGTYGATQRLHYHTLCGASFAMVMSAFEVTWRSLFGCIVDTTDRYDDKIVELLKSNQDIAESVLAHRGEDGAGSLIVSALGVWQKSATINQRFHKLLKIDPIANSDLETLSEMWQRPRQTRCLMVGGEAH